MGKKCVYMTGGSFCRFITVPPFDDTSYNQIEAQILTFFNRSDIVTPDEVRGSYSTLSQAVLQNTRYVTSLHSQ